MRPDMFRSATLPDYELSGHAAQLHRELEVAYCRPLTISADNTTKINE